MALISSPLKKTQRNVAICFVPCDSSKPTTSKVKFVISHIRRASDPTAPSFINSHPFAGELYGFTHVFAHNGEVLEIFQDRRFEPKYYFPLGDTDSERAFCALMDRLREGLTPATVMDFRNEACDYRKLGPRGFGFGRLQFPSLGQPLFVRAPLDASLLYSA
jgi:hypothetical protein